jgi:tRNA (cytidine/uridine-2'-O-)-methyltransferase
MQIVLYQPEIPPNTGNIARLCAATQTILHLVRPLGFSLEDKYLRRAGLDYWEHVQVRVWEDWQTFLQGNATKRLVYSSARRGAAYHSFAYAPGDLLVFGPESRGLPPELTAPPAPCIRIPIWGRVRSLNIAASASIILYEALRQTGGLPGQESTD